MRNNALSKQIYVFFNICPPILLSKKKAGSLHFTAHNGYKLLNISNMLSGNSC